VQVARQPTPLFVLRLQQPGVEGTKLGFRLLQLRCALLHPRLQLIARQHLLGDVDGMHQNAFRFSLHILQRLVAEGGVDHIFFAVAHQPQLAFAGQERLAGFEHLIQQSKDALFFHLGKHFGDRSPDDLVGPFASHQFQVGGIHKSKAMLRAREQGHSSWSHGEGFAQPAAFEVGLGSQKPFHLGCFGSHPRQPEVSSHPRQKLARRERFYQVVVRAGVQAFHPRLLTGPRRE